MNKKVTKNYHRKIFMYNLLIGLGIVMILSGLGIRLSSAFILSGLIVIPIFISNKLIYRHIYKMKTIKKKDGV